VRACVCVRGTCSIAGQTFGWLHANEDGSSPTSYLPSYLPLLAGVGNERCYTTLFPLYCMLNRCAITIHDRFMNYGYIISLFSNESSFKSFRLCRSKLGNRFHCGSIMWRIQLTSANQSHLRTGHIVWTIHARK